MESLGLLHLYYGDGKGKTTAAMGLQPLWGLPCGRWAAENVWSSCSF